MKAMHVNLAHSVHIRTAHQRSSLILRWVLLCSLHVLVLLAAGQVTIHLHLPPPGQFTPEDFTEAIAFNNSTSNTYAARLHATLEEELAGLIFSGTSSVFSLEPGYITPHYTVYEPLELIYSQPQYESYVIRHNGLPPGNYTLCVMVMDAGALEEIGRQCAPMQIFNPSPPILVYPAHESRIQEPQPVFIWLPPAPPPPGEVLFRFVITEMHEGQLPEEAIRTNPPLYSASEIPQPLLPYPVNASGLLEGRRYVWQVQALSIGGIPLGMNDGFGEPSTFVYGGTSERHILALHPLAPCTGEITAGITAYEMTVKWQATGDFQTFQVIVSANPCGQYPPQPPTPTPTPVPNPSPTVTPQPTPQPTPTLAPTTPTGNIPVGSDTTSGNSPGGGIITGGVSSGSADTIGGIQPADSIPVGSDWPDEGETDLPTLPPGWEWGVDGVRWTGKHPIVPPELPPGWEWGPTRPGWMGEGDPPVPRRVIGWSDPVTITPTPSPKSTQGAQFSSSLNNSHHQITVPLGDFLVPGQAFIYQIYGTFINGDGKTNGYLSAPQCLRFNHVSGADPGNDLQPAPLDCDPCLVKLELDTTPSMNGGLFPWKDSLEIFRDDFIVLHAIGADYDLIKWRCTPKPDCHETGSHNGKLTSSRVKFQWQIAEGEGDFVEVGCQKPEKETDGDRVIFMPPYVAPDSTKTTLIKLSIIDDNATQPRDATILRNIELKISRKKDDVEHYRIIIKSDSFEMGHLPQISGDMQGTCKARGPGWSLDDDLSKAPIILLPKTADAQKLVFHELIRLSANDIHDRDRLRVWCEAVRCPTNDTTEVYEDDIEYIWRITSGKGDFVSGHIGRFVIFRASDTEGDVTLEVNARNRNSLKIADKPSPSGKVTLTVYKPGIRMEQTALEWLPEFREVMMKRSYLVYQDKNQWKEGLNHQCRIHRVELMDVSKEPGITMNWPPDDFWDPNLFIDSCPDFSFLPSEQWELFDTVYCERCFEAENDTAWCKTAHSRRPEKEFMVAVHCYDYGAYGYIRSTANPNQQPEGLYASVAWKKSDLSHPVVGRVITLDPRDNRVTMPKDVDENRIADWGWTTRSHEISGSRLRIRDPWNPSADDDDLPKNPNRGDGLSCYEEYRGIMAKGVHHRLDPERKNVMIWDPDDFGLGLFRNSGVSVLHIEWNEMDTSRTINANRRTHQLGFNQKGIRLRARDLSSRGLAGLSDSIGMVFSHNVWIDPRYRNDKPFMNYLVPHELSHALGAWHHGEGYIFGVLPRDSFITIDNRKGKNDSADWAIFRIACRQGLSSGAESCWMRYPNYLPYCTAADQPNVYNCPDTIYNLRITNWKLVTVSLTRYGTRITNHPEGSGSNSGGKCGGNAAPGRGKCLDQLKVSTKP